MKKTIMFAAVAGLVFALTPAARAQTIVFEEHWVDPEAEANPGWGRTRQEYVWPAPTDADWVPGLDVSEYKSAAEGGARWEAYGATPASFNLSNLYEAGDPRNASYPAPDSPTPDGDGWHFAGIHDGAGFGDHYMHTTPGTVNIPAGDRNETKLDLHYASANGDGKGFRISAQAGDNWYVTGEIGFPDGNLSTGGWTNGRVSEWVTESLEIESAEWFDYDFSAKPFTIGAAPYAGLPAGDITAIGFTLLANGNGDKWAFDNILITVPGGVPGDVDGDGDVDINDMGYFEAQFGQSGLPLPPGANSADLDADGDVDLHDLVFIRDNFGAGPAAPAAATPEPATMTVLALGGMLVLRRRRS